MELRNEKDARFIIRHHVTEKKLLHLEKGVRKLGFQSGGKRIMTIFLGLFLLCMAAKVVIGGTIGDALMMIGILCAMGFVFGIYGTIPSDGTQFEVTANGLQIKVLSIKEHRLQHALVQKQTNIDMEQPESEVKNHAEL